MAFKEMSCGIHRLFLLKTVLRTYFIFHSLVTVHARIGCYH